MNLTNRFSITGSRAATSYGVPVAGEISSELASQEKVVVSGRAYGIDAAVHRSHEPRYTTIRDATQADPLLPDVWSLRRGDDRRKKLPVHLEGAVSVDLLKEEQDKIARRIAFAAADPQPSLLRQALRPDGRPDRR